MKRHIARNSHISLYPYPRMQFVAAWVAAFLGFALILGVVFWAMNAYS